MVNHFYFYAVDRDFGPFFLKFCGVGARSAEFQAPSTIAAVRPCT